MAQAVFYCMFFAYPKSRSKINNDGFKQRLYELISEKVTGITVQNQGYKKWVLDLGAGNVFERSRSRPHEGLYRKLPAVRSKQDLSRKSSDIRYSPLVNRYLQYRRYEALNAIKPWNMRFSMRNLQNERVIDKKFSHYRQQAVVAEKNAIDREQSYKEFSDKIDAKIQEDHNAYIRHVRRLKKYTDKIIREDPHEYANKIISMNQQTVDEVMAMNKYAVARMGQVNMLN